MIDLETIRFGIRWFEQTRGRKPSEIVLTAEDYAHIRKVCKAQARYKGKPGPFMLYGVRVRKEVVWKG